MQYALLFSDLQLILALMTGEGHPLACYASQPQQLDKTRDHIPLPSLELL
jgi:hypothetical protein